VDVDVCDVESRFRCRRTRFPFVGVMGVFAFISCLSDAVVGVVVVVRVSVVAVEMVVAVVHVIFGVDSGGGATFLDVTFLDVMVEGIEAESRGCICGCDLDFETSLPSSVFKRRGDSLTLLLGLVLLLLLTDGLFQGDTVFPLGSVEGLG